MKCNKKEKNFSNFIICTKRIHNLNELNEWMNVFCLEKIKWMKWNELN